jgi:VanZ family protein
MPIATSTASRNYRFIVAAVALYWVLIFAGTHYPKPPELLLHTSDKVLHFSAYLGLAMLLVAWWQMVPPMTRKGPRRIIFTVILILAAYGAFDEVTQIPAGRDCDALDWLADVSGGTLGALLATAAFSAWRRRRQASPAATDG